MMHAGTSLATRHAQLGHGGMVGAGRAMQILEGSSGPAAIVSDYERAADALRRGGAALREAIA